MGDNTEKRAVNTDDIVDNERLDFLRALSRKGMEDRPPMSDSDWGDDEDGDDEGQGDGSDEGQGDGDGSGDDGDGDGAGGEPTGDDEPDGKDSDAEPQPEMIKVKIDGEEREVPLSDVMDAGLRSYQIGQTADKRLQEVSELLKQLKAQDGGGQAPTSTGQDDSISAEEELNAAIDEVVQAQAYGTPEEYKKAVIRLNEIQMKSSASNFDSKIQERLDSEFRKREEFRQEQENELIMKDLSKPTEQGGYKDLLDDYRARALYIEEVNRLHASGAPNTLETYRKAGDSVRKFIGWSVKDTGAGGGDIDSRRRKKFKEVDNIKSTGANAGKQDKDALPKTHEEVIRDGYSYLKRMRGDV